MNLVDSSGWLEYFVDGKNAKFFAPVIEDTENLIVSVINIYEIYKKILIEKDENKALQSVSLMQQAKIVEVNSSIAIQAAKLSSLLKLPMADSLIYTTAQIFNAVLWTQDVDFKNLENVKYFKKS
ncbi:MAG: type II toxin-antitoxin system VapC family toxin [Ignavibacteriales bacterium]|nr:type II toxin-antitoxin system VapC family toxin [Ignavibacteriales bacterium]